MAYTRGRCTNIDYCTLADAKRDIEVLVGEDFVCPECARPLRPPPQKEASSGTLNLAVAGGVLAVLLIGGGIFAGYRMSAPPPRVMAQAPLLTVPAPASAPLARPAAPPVPAVPQPTILLRVAATPALAASLAPHLASAYLAFLGDANVVAHAGARPGEATVTGQRLSAPESIVIGAGAAAEPTDAGSLAALARHDANAALISRRITQTEHDQLRGVGDLTAPENEHAVGFQTEAIIVNPANTLAQLSTAQLRGVLDGGITKWSQLGGAARPIHLLREIGAGTLADILPGGLQVSSTIHNVHDAAAAVADDVDAVAIVDAARVGRGRVISLAATGALPALPTPANVASEAYPLARRLYLYTPGNDANPFVQRFAKFVTAPEGQSAVLESGMVPLRVAPVAPPAPLTPKDRYKQLVVGTKRLAADLHFEPNSNKLDVHSAREVDRVWNYMMSDHTPSDHLILIGFADNQGQPEANLNISKGRAQAVAEVFTRRGLPPGQIVAFGSELPIADNGTEDGRQKNRRVEVFLRP